MKSQDMLFAHDVTRDVLHKKLLLLLLLLKKIGNARQRGRLTPYQSEDPSPTIPTYRGKEEKVKIVEDKKGESN